MSEMVGLKRCLFVCVGGGDMTVNFFRISKFTRIRFTEQNIKVSENLKYGKMLPYMSCTTLSLGFAVSSKASRNARFTLHYSTDIHYFL